MSEKLSAKVFSFVGYLANFIVINLLCIACCIPVVTAGPSICAMYYCILKVVRKQEMKPVKDFFHSFKDNLKQGCILQLIVLAVSIVTAFLLKYAISIFANGSFYQVIACIIFIIAFAILLDFTMLYPAQAQFANPLNITFKNAFLFAISNLPYVLIMLLLNILPILLFLGWTELFIVLIPFYLFMGFAGTCYANCRFLKKIFKPYVAEESKTEEI